MLFNVFRKDDGGTKLLTSQQLADFLAQGSSTSSGVTVTPKNALTYSAAFACVKVLAESIGQLPLHVMKRLDRGAQKAGDHPLYALLHDTGPNEFQTAQEWLEWVGACLALRGNSYSFITRVRGEIRELLPIAPGAVTPKMLDDYTTVYDVQLKSGPRRFKASEILHLKLFTLDGLEGLSPISWQRETLGMGLAAQQHGARLFSNSARPGGILSTEKSLSKDAMKRLRGDVEEIVGGPENAHRMLILGEGMKWQQMGFSSQDAEWLAGRKFTRSEVCGIYRVPPHMIGDLERATFSNIEHQGLDFVVHALMPYLTRIEARARKQLLTEDERREFFLKFNVAGLLRGDMAARSNYYSRGILDGWLTRNEARELEDRNPIDGLDLPLAPLNMTDGTKPPPPQKPTPPPDAAKTRAAELERDGAAA